MKYYNLARILEGQILTFHDYGRKGSGCSGFFWMFGSEGSKEFGPLENIQHVSATGSTNVYSFQVHNELWSVSHMWQIGCFQSLFIKTRNAKEMHITGTVCPFLLGQQES